MNERPIIIFSIRQLAQKVGRDFRTVSRKLEQLEMMPFAVSVSGEAFYRESDLERLLEHELQPEVQTS